MTTAGSYPGDSGFNVASWIVTHPATDSLGNPIDAGSFGRGGSFDGGLGRGRR